MKKLISMFLATTMILMLSACGQSSASASSSIPTNSEAAGESSAPIEITWCVHTSTGLVEPTMQRFIQNLKDIVGEDRVIETHYSAGTMGSEAELAQAVMMGDLTMTTPSVNQSLPNSGHPDWSAIPGIVTNMDEAYKYILDIDAPLYNHMNEQLQSAGALILGQGMDNGFRCIATSNPCETVEDLKHLKTRVANAWGAIALYDGVGLQSTIIDSSEVMAALQQGTIDAVENGIVNLVNQGYADLLDKVLLINFNYTWRNLICNKDWFNELSNADQEAVMAAATEATEWANANMADQYEAALNDARWTVVELSNEQYTAFKDSATKALEKAYEKCDPADVDFVKEVTGLGA